MSGLTAQQHRLVQEEARRRRNAAARARRAGRAERAPRAVRVLRVHDPWEAGGPPGPLLWVALSRSHPQIGYLLREGPDGRPLCGCPGFAIRGRCGHIEALFARLAPSPPEGGVFRPDQATAVQASAEQNRSGEPSAEQTVYHHTQERNRP